MHENLFIKEGKNTPKVFGNIDASEISFEGNSYPENVLQFYSPIVQWIDEFNQSSDSIKIVCKFYYIASSSVIAFLKLLQKIESTFKQDGISIVWKFEEGDDDIRKIGQDYSTILNTHIDIIEVEES